MIRSVLDRASLLQLAVAGGGEYFEIGDEPDRIVAFRIVDRLRRRADVVKEIESFDELYGRFVGLRVNGAGIWIQTHGTRYEGEFRSSRWWGFGVIRERNGTIYEGEFIDGMRHGLGVQTAVSGEKTEGRWDKGVYKGAE